MDDTGSIITVSTCVRGLYGIENDVYSSLPCVLGASGERPVVILPLDWLYQVLQVGVGGPEESLGQRLMNIFRLEVLSPCNDSVM